MVIFYKGINKKKKQVKMKLENITIVFHSITYYDPFDHLSYVTEQNPGGIAQISRLKLNRRKISTSPRFDLTVRGVNQTNIKTN